MKALAKKIDALWLSDHLCWTGIQGKNTHDLLPLPYTDEAVSHLVDRIQQVQDFFGYQILIENVSSYITYTESSLTEWDFIKTISEEADCLLLLDVNNIYVSAFNHGFDPMAYLAGIPQKRVFQIHLAGHSNMGDHIIDTHDHAIIDPVWDLYRAALNRFGSVPTMIERDGDIPPLSTLLVELNHAKKIAECTLSMEPCA